MSPYHSLVTPITGWSCFLPGLCQNSFLGLVRFPFQGAEPSKWLRDFLGLLKAPNKDQDAGLWQVLGSWPLNRDYCRLLIGAAEEAPEFLGT